MGESLASVERHSAPLAEATTPSVEALKAYSTGMKVVLSSGNEAAIPFFRRAVEIDPKFAMAYAELGLSYSATGESVRSAESTTRAWQLRDRVSESVGVDRMQRNFEPMRRQVETWRAQQLTSATAKLIIYRAFIEDELDSPKHIARRVHDLYFAPEHEDFQPRTAWSLSNAFTSAFKELDPIPQFKATAKLGPYLERVLGS